MAEDKQIKDKKEEKAKKSDDAPKDDKGNTLTEQEIALIKRYGKGPYHEVLKTVEDEIKTNNNKITTLCGIKESDTGLSLPN